MKLFKKSDIVPDIDFAAKGMVVKYGTYKPEEGNQIVANPDNTPRVLKVCYNGRLDCVATGKTVVLSDNDTWRYHGKYKPYVEPDYY